MDDMEALATRAQPAEPKKDPPNAFALRDLEDVFREHHTLVFRAAYRITGNAQDAEDVLQTVFLRLARREEDAAQVDNLPCYLRRAATNAAFDLMRSRQRANSMPLEDLEPVLAGDPSRSPERLYQASEMLDWLRGTVSRLSPMAAQIFALRFFEGKDNPEIAQIVGTSLGAVSVTLSRARDRVEKEFHAYWRTQS
jgi:RNA polymerase sigma-70 factor (ECF subfamily)